MKRNVVVKRGIYCTCAETVGNAPKTYLVKLPRQREAKERYSREENTDRGNYTRAELCHSAVGKQAGNYRACGYYHSDNSHIGEGNVHLGI